MLVFVTDIANIWLARVEATNALEASALAAVKHWKDGGNSPANRRAARRAAVRYAAANTVLGNAVNINRNNSATGDVNNNRSPSGNVVLGEICFVAGQAIFKANQSPTDSERFGVRTQATVPVSSLWNGFGGFSFGPYSVSVEAVALCRGSGQPRLVRIDQFQP